MGGVAPGERVLVLGPGPIGLGIAIAAQARGADVLLAGFNDGPRLALAREMGIPACADLAGQDLDTAIADRFAAPPDLVFEATGRPETVAEGLEALRPGGILVAVGIHSRPLTLDLNLLVRGKKHLRGSHDSTRASFEAAIAMLAAEPARFARMITHRLPLSQAEQGFARARDGTALKVMLFPKSRGGELV